MIRAIRNILILFALAILAIVGAGLYQQYLGGDDSSTIATESTTAPPAPEADAEPPSAPTPEAAEPEAQERDEADAGIAEPEPAAEQAAAEAPSAEDGVSVEVPQDGGAEYFALSVKLIDQGVVEIKSRREEGETQSYVIYLVTCDPLRSGVVAESDDLAGLAQRNETPEMSEPAENTAERTLAVIACASVEGN